MTIDLSNKKTGNTFETKKCEQKCDSRQQKDDSRRQNVS